MRLSEDMTKSFLLKGNKKMGKSEKKEGEIASSLKKIVWGAGIVFFGRILGKLIGYFYVMFVARLGTEQYGMLNLGFAISSFLTTIALVGLTLGVVRYVSYYNAKEDKARVKGALTSGLKISLPLSLILAFIMFIFSEQISVYLFHNPALTPVLKIFSFTIPFMAAAYLFMAGFMGFKRVDYDTGLREITEKLVRLVFVLLLVSLGFGVLGAAFSYLISAFAIFVISLYLMEKKVFPFLRTKIKPVYYTKELLFYSMPLLLTGVLSFILDWTDTLMIGYFKTTSEVGIYNAAGPTAALMFVFSGALISLFLPIMTQFYSKKKIKEMKKVYNVVSRWIFLINLPVFLLMAIFSKQILRVVFGQAYTPAALSLVLLSFGYLIYSLSSTSNIMLCSIKKTKTIFIITLVYAGINILMNYILIPIYGINGAAIATSASFLVGSLLFFLFNYRFTRLQPFKLSYLKPLASALISISVVYFTAKTLFEVMPLYGFVLMFLLFFAIYLLLLILFKSFEKEDMAMLKIIFGKFRLPDKLKFFWLDKLIQP